MANNNRRNGRSDNAYTGAPRWVVFMGGVTSGVIATVLVGALMWPRPLTSGDASDTDSATAGKTQANDSGDSIHYEYDSVLRDSEVPVPPAATAEAPPLVSAAPARVVLQAGSFRIAGDAESLRAQLLLLDIGPVSTREVLVKDGEVWHRVLIGPFANDTALRKAQDKLMQQNINTFSIAAPADMPVTPPAAYSVERAREGPAEIPVEKPVEKPSAPAGISAPAPPRVAVGDSP